MIQQVGLWLQIPNVDRLTVERPNRYKPEEAGGLAGEQHDSSPVPCAQFLITRVEDGPVASAKAM
ncbi:MAG: hypothetical protein HUU41_13725 [Bryobacteraceae bacterium]|nr:hypothetical protein [Bryobacterales bacterium]MEB2362719.1 hypothetical protein [Bryobacterales bacterium]NUN02169.1 hypothetical protein [Bryobacteraceae bacterium]